MDAAALSTTLSVQQFQRELPRQDRPNGKRHPIGALKLMSPLGRQAFATEW
jgi:hypothetical protein